MSWNPSTSAPGNDIGTAYVAAVVFHNTIYNHSKIQSFTTTTKPPESSMTSTYKHTLIPDSIEEDNNRNVEYRIQGGMFAHAQITGLSPSSTPKSQEKRSNPSKNVSSRTAKQNKMPSMTINMTSTNKNLFEGHEELRIEQQVNVCNPTVDNFFKQKDIGNDGDPLGSDCEVEDNKFDDGESARTKRKGSHHSEYKHIASNTVGEAEDINDGLWEKDIDIPPPEEKSCL
eukprot:9685403-Ditylum_brightwellii.AAC.1